MPDFMKVDKDDEARAQKLRGDKAAKSAPKKEA